MAPVQNSYWLVSLDGMIWLAKQVVQIVCPFVAAGLISLISFAGFAWGHCIGFGVSGVPLEAAARGMYVSRVVEHLSAMVCGDNIMSSTMLCCS